MSQLLNDVRAVVRLKHLSLRTEEADTYWIKKYILFHQKRHPREMGANEVRDFLTYLAVEKQVAAATQNQALNALLFLYREVLGVRLEGIDAVRAQKPVRLPVVFSVAEVRLI